MFAARIEFSTLPPSLPPPRSRYAFCSFERSVFSRGVFRLFFSPLFFLLSTLLLILSRCALYLWRCTLFLLNLSLERDTNSASNGVSGNCGVRMPSLRSHRVAFHCLGAIDAVATKPPSILLFDWFFFFKSCNLICGNEVFIIHSTKFHFAILLMSTLFSLFHLPFDFNLHGPHSLQQMRQEMVLQKEGEMEFSLLTHSDDMKRVSMRTQRFVDIVTAMLEWA